MATHNLPLPVFDCLAELLPKIIPDSKIIKQMTLHHKKARYTLVFGTALHMKKQLIKQLQLFRRLCRSSRLRWVQLPRCLQLPQSWNEGHEP